MGRASAYGFVDILEIKYMISALIYLVEEDNYFLQQRHKKFNTMVN